MPSVPADEEGRDLRRSEKRDVLADMTRGEFDADGGCVGTREGGSGGGSSSGGGGGDDVERLRGCCGDCAKVAATPGGSRKVVAGLDAIAFDATVAFGSGRERWASGSDGAVVAVPPSRLPFLPFNGPVKEEAGDDAALTTPRDVPAGSAAAAAAVSFRTMRITSASSDSLGASSSTGSVIGATAAAATRLDPSLATRGMLAIDALPLPLSLSLSFLPLRVAIHPPPSFLSKPLEREIRLEALGNTCEVGVSAAAAVTAEGRLEADGNGLRFVPRAPEAVDGLRLPRSDDDDDVAGTAGGWGAGTGCEVAAERFPSGGGGRGVGSEVTGEVEAGDTGGTEWVMTTGERGATGRARSDRLVSE
jgi:hypothetical protein